MPRRNPGPFEPILYLIQTPSFFRVVGIGGLVLFTILFLGKAAAHSAGAFIFGLAMLAALWLESTMTACRRCRHFDTWHCAGQGIIAARLFTRLPSGVGQPRVLLHFGLVALYLIYGLFWMWHGAATGILFTIWAVLFVMSAIPADGFSWKSAPRSAQVA
jgi:hypothetical protein